MMTAHEYTPERSRRAVAAGKASAAAKQQRALENRTKDAVFRDMLILHIVGLQESATETRARAEALDQYDRGRFVLEAMAFERELAAASVRHILLLTAPEILVGKAV